MNSNDENIEKSLLLYKKEEFDIMINPCLDNCLNEAASLVINPTSENEGKISEEIFNSIDKSRNLSSFFIHSSQLKEQLAQKQLIAGKTKKTAMSIVLEVNSKWHSFYSSLKSIESLHEHISSILYSDQKYKEMHQHLLQEEELGVLRDILKIFEKFSEISDHLSNSYYTTCGVSLKLLDYLMKLMTREETSNDSISTKGLKKLLISSLRKQIKKIQREYFFLLASSFLCPINKNLKFIEKDSKDVSIKKVKTFLIEIYTTYLEKLTCSNLQRDSKKKKIDLNQFDSDDEQVDTNESKFEKEFNKYSEMTYKNEKEDALDFWRSQITNFLIFTELAFLLLPAPAISFPSEVLYISGGYGHYERRKILSPEHLDIANFIAVNALEIQ